MAHRITYKPIGIILSSSIGDVGVSVEGTYVDVTLADQYKRVILSERYYAYHSEVTLCDFASLIESDMRISGYTYADYTLSVFTDTPGNKGDSCVLHILYCDRFSVCQDVPKFLSENFLTTMQTRRIAPDGATSLYFFADKGESMLYSVEFFYRVKGELKMYSDIFEFNINKTATEPRIVQADVMLDRMIDNAAHNEMVPLPDITLVYFIVRAGERSATFYVDYSLSDRNAFVFRNCFNLLEIASITAVTTAKTDVDRSTAIINGKSQFYNQSVSKTYEAETAPLSADEAEWIDQLFTSHEVFRIVPDPTSEYDPLVIVPVLITDSTCEIQDGDEKLNTVKFTWRFADNRPMVQLSASPGIFSSPYNIVYS